MNRIFIDDAISKIGEEVLLKDWVHARRGISRIVAKFSEARAVRIVLRSERQARQGKIVCGNLKEIVQNKGAV